MEEITKIERKILEKRQIIARHESAIRRLEIKKEKIEKGFYTKKVEKIEKNEKKINDKKESKSVQKVDEKLPENEEKPQSWW